MQSYANLMSPQTQNLNMFAQMANGNYSNNPIAMMVKNYMQQQSAKQSQNYASQNPGTVQTGTGTTSAPITGNSSISSLANLNYDPQISGMQIGGMTVGTPQYSQPQAQQQQANYVNPYQQQINQLRSDNGINATIPDYMLQANQAPQTQQTPQFTGYNWSSYGGQLPVTPQQGTAT